MKYLKSAVMAALIDTGLAVNIPEKVIEYEAA